MNAPLAAGTGPARVHATLAGQAIEGDNEPAALVVTHWFDSGPPGRRPYDAIVRVRGRRHGVSGRPSTGDTFSVTESIRGVVPGSGRISTTSWIYGINPGEWDVDAEIVGPEHARAALRDHRLPRASWSWRSWSLGSSGGACRTRWAPLAPLAATPAVLPGSFTVLALVAIVAAIVVQPLFLGHQRLDAGAPVLASVVGLLAGVVGAKAWYMALKGPSRRTLKEGWSVDGFLVTAPVVATLVASAQGVPVAAFLDGATPGMFIAVAIGRIGCFLTGCCAGRVTAGWGLWSSDRRVGAKRVPTQLIECAVGLSLAALSTVVILGHVGSGSGLVFVTATVLYVTARQGLLRLRAEARPFSWRRAPGGAAAA
jgi:phosphatidylglycerol:prolipoprotein diacylglycerol transferase